MTAALAERVSAHPFLTRLAPEHRAALAADATVSSFISGVRLFAEGAVADRFWLLESGTVALDVPVPGRGDVIVETLVGPTVLGWSWLYPPYRWHFGAVAREPSVALVFDAASVRQRCERNPAFGYAVMSLFAPVIIQRLQATRLRMLDLYAPRPASPGLTSEERTRREGGASEASGPARAERAQSDTAPRNTP